MELFRRRDIFLRFVLYFATVLTVRYVFLWYIFFYCILELFRQCDISYVFNIYVFTETGNETAMGAAISREDCGRKVTNTTKFIASYNKNKSKEDCYHNGLIYRICSHHDIAEILLKLALNTNLSINITIMHFSIKWLMS